MGAPLKFRLLNIGAAITVTVTVTQDGTRNTEYGGHKTRCNVI